MASYIFIQFNPKHTDGFYFAATTKIVGVNIPKNGFKFLLSGRQESCMEPFYVLKQVSSSVSCFGACCFAFLDLKAALDFPSG